MSQNQKLVIVGLVVAVVGVAGGLVYWWTTALSSAERQIVGVWDCQILSEPKAKVTFKGAPPAIAGDLSNQFANMFRPVEQIRFDRNGKVRIVSNILGAEITQEGTWTARRAEGDQLVVTAQMRKMSVREPKGKVRENAWEKTVEWAVTVLDADRLRVSTVDDKGNRQQSNWRRAKP